MSNESSVIPHYFIPDGEGFDPSGLARNPWFSNAVAGGPIAALIGHVIEAAGFDPGFEICRLTIDILGVVPRRTLAPRITPVRQGRQAQLHRIELRSEEHTSELQSLMRISYAVFCLKKKNTQK